MNTHELLNYKNELGEKMDKASKALGAFVAPHRGAMGLISDEIRTTAEYKKLRNDYAQAHATLRRFNQLNSKNKELAKASRDQIWERRLAKTRIV